MTMEEYEKPVMEILDTENEVIQTSGCDYEMPDNCILNS